MKRGTTKKKKTDKTFSDLSNDYPNKFVLAHVHVDFSPLNTLYDFRLHKVVCEEFDGKCFFLWFKASNQLQIGK